MATPNLSRFEICPRCVVEGDWPERASCRVTDNPDIFTNAQSIKEEEAAKSICRLCVVSDECLFTALYYPPEHSEGQIRGGYTSQERRALQL